MVSMERTTSGSPSTDLCSMSKNFTVDTPIEFAVFLLASALNMSISPFPLIPKNIVKPSSSKNVNLHKLSRHETKFPNKILLKKDKTNN